MVSGTRTLSGSPILANDPHRGVSVPALRYVVHLVGPGWNAIGSGEPTVPGVSMGHNEQGAWGLTIHGRDMEDLYVYDTNPDNPNQYRYQDEWEDMRILRETIPVKGQDAVPVDLKFTRGRVDQGRCRPQPPTDPDVRVLPHPAPRQMASLRARGRVNGRQSRERVSREEAEEPLPRHRSLLRPTVEPLLPDVDNVEAERRQARGVPRNPVGGTVPTQLPHQHPMLLGDRRVAVRAAPAIDSGQTTPEAVLRRLSLEHPAALPGDSPVVREPQEVERAGVVGIRHRPAPGANRSAVGGTEPDGSSPGAS